MSFFRHLRILLWKNYLLKKRAWGSTLAEILLPLLVGWILVLIRAAVTRDNFQTDLHLKDTVALNADYENVMSSFLYNNSFATSSRIAFISPSLNMTQELINNFVNRYPKLSGLPIAFNSEGELLSHFADANYANGDAINHAPIYLALILNAGSPNWVYTIRGNFTNDNQYSSMIDTRTPAVDVIHNIYDSGSASTIVRKGWLFIQKFMEDFIIQKETSIPASRSGYLVPFPTPAYVFDSFSDQISNYVGLLFTLVYLWPVTRIIKSIVEEKSSRIKEGMKIMGVGEAAIWSSWFITYLIIFFVIAILLTFIMRPIFLHSNPGYIILFFWLYGISLFAMCYLVSSFFSNPKVASVLGAVVFFASYFPYLAVSDANTDANSKLSASLLMNVGLSFGLVSITAYEGAETGIINSNAGTPYQNFSYNNGIGMFIADFFIYTVLGLYFSRVIVPEWGTPLPWYFPFLKSFWFPDSFEAAKEKSKGLSTGNGSGADGSPLLVNAKTGDNRNIEPVSAAVAANVAVKIRNLVKQFETVDGIVSTAVDNLTLDMYSGQILALLGHNGAGKTTTINMLTGMLSVTSGDATVFGLSIKSDMQSIRQSLGFCPQHNILFDELTVSEHLELFAGIKSVPSSEVRKVIDEAISSVGLVEKANYRTGALSGGQQRKLSVAIALMGNSKIVFLDEPTSGMDPYSRRATWDLLNHKKAELDENGLPKRVIILTTHFMDEADQLGDRIAIMSKGSLRCVGSSLFLKSQYGVGYTLTVSKRLQLENESNEKDKSSLLDPIAISHKISGIVSQHVPSSTLLSDVAGEISFRLPLKASSEFPDLFERFDREKDQIGIASYGISVTTLEEIFIKILKDGEVDSPSSKPNNSNSNNAPQIQNENQSTFKPIESRDVNLKTFNEEKEPVSSDSDHNQNATVFFHPITENNNNNENKDYIPPSNSPPTESSKGKADKVVSVNEDSSDMSVEMESNTSWPLIFIRHFRALFVKRYINARRDRRVLIWTILAPLIMTCVGIGLQQANKRDAPYQRVSTLDYNSPNPIPYSSSSYIYSDVTSLAPFTGENSNYLRLNSYLAPANLTANTLNLGTPYSPSDPAFANFSIYLLNTIPSLALSRYSAYITNLQYGTSNGTGYISDKYVIYFNTTGAYSASANLNLYNTLTLRALKGDGYSISVGVHPFPLTANQKELFSSFISVFLGFGFAFIPASFIAYSVKEAGDKVKHQQLISGVSVTAYWMSSYAWDIINCIVPGLLCYAIVAMYGISELINDASGAVLLGILLYALSVIPFAYMCSFLFNDYTSAQNLMLMVFIIAGGFLIIADVLLDIFESTRTANKSLKFIYRLFPSFCFSEAIASLVVRNSVTATFGNPKQIWDMTVTGWPYIFMAWESVAYFIIVLIIENVLSTPAVLSFLSKCGNNGTDIPLRVFEDEDSDVVAEKQKLLSAVVTSQQDNSDSSLTKEAICIKGLRKVYPPRLGQKAKVAVHDLFLEIPKGMCYGYLGINGAGKTTTLKMLTGDVIPTSGSAYLAGLDISTNQSEVRRLLGYCPQFDALVPSLTAREHLTLFARIKGVKEDKVEAYVQTLLNHLGLQKGIEDKPAGGYSGGNKRKLCVGIALIGNPPIVFLDEPSTGMDPGSRRQMWDLISRTMSGRSVILTTHSMEECEALCQKIGVMVGGRLRCSGTAQHLKTKYGQGFQIHVHVQLGQFSEKFMQFFKLHFPEYVILENHGDDIKFRIPKISKVLPQSADDHSLENKGAADSEASGNPSGVVQNSIGKIFRLIETSKHLFGDSFEYSVSETTLEQIFIYFAKQQEEETGPVAGIN